MRAATGGPAISWFRVLGPSFALVVLCAGLFAAWLLGGISATPATTLRVTDLALAAGPLLALPLCWLGGWPGERPRAPILLGLGLCCAVAGHAVAGYHRYVGQPQLSPSLADWLIAAMYPVLWLGLLGLAGPCSIWVRLRLAIDSVLIVTTGVTFLWLPVLAERMLDGRGLSPARDLVTAYMLADQVLFVGALLLLVRPSDGRFRPALAILLFAFALMGMTDASRAGLPAHGSGSLDTLLPLGLLVGLLLIGLGGRAARVVPPADPPATGYHLEPIRVRMLPIWQILVPYALVLCVVALALYTWSTTGDADRKPGVYVGGALLIWLALSHQALMILQHRDLYRVVNDAYRKTLEYAERTQQLNLELRTTQEALQVNHQALSSAGVHMLNLWEQASTDPLTDLLNHRAVEAALDRELERAYRYGRVCAILFLDLDRFKLLNDTYGHLAGDTALRGFADLVRGTLRNVDIVGRWGGEELVAILPETDVAAALVAADHVRIAVAGADLVPDQQVRITCSIGVAVYPRDGLSRADLVDAADRAMYTAKRLGRDQSRLAGDPAVVDAGTPPHAAIQAPEAALQDTVEALATLVEARDHFTSQHAQDVGRLALRLALALGLDGQEARTIGMAGRLHDLGKIAIPDTILRKPSALQEEEWALVRAHPAIGAAAVGRVPALRAVAPYIRAHHERWDGRGYPDGLAGAAIPLGGRIISVADTYVTMIAGRPYQRAADPEQAIEELRRCGGTQFDPAVVEALERVLTKELGMVPLEAPEWETAR